MEALPTNYRPPSSFGRDIPISDNIYNADATKDMNRNFYAISKDSGKFKPIECSSTVKDESEENSDCIVSAQQVIASFLITPAFTISDSGVEMNSDKRYTLREVNNRTDYCPSSISDCTNAESVQGAIYTQNTTIKWTGAELYHFIASANVDSDEYCVLEDSFLVYVILSAPRTSTLAATMATTGIIFALSLFGVYVQQMDK
jgi:hypothetical protein